MNDPTSQESGAAGAQDPPSEPTRAGHDDIDPAAMRAKVTGLALLS